MTKMTDGEWRAFVSAGTRTGKAAVTTSSGHPHVTPVWFVLDGDDLVFTTGASGVKGRALRRDPRISIAVDDQTPPYSFVQIQGEAALSQDLAEMRRVATDIAARYMGAGRAAEFGERNTAGTEVVVRVRITKVIAERDIAA
jgi:PPOX class probable F420-dependent enzyme